MMNNNIFYQNGFIIQRINTLNMGYSGVEGDNWFINSESDNLKSEKTEYIYNYYCRNIDKSWIDNYVECCSDLYYINTYLDICRMQNISINILYCETQRKYPLCKLDVNLKESKLKFLGYDYAYPGGSFYSCVNNDLNLRSIPELRMISLNKYGLISDEFEMIKFINKREEVKKNTQENMFEVGDFIIYKLWKVDF